MMTYNHMNRIVSIHVDHLLSKDVIKKKQVIQHLFLKVCLIEFYCTLTLN